MTAPKVISDRFKVSSLLGGRLKEHQVSLPAVLRRAGLPAGFFQTTGNTGKKRRLSNLSLSGAAPPLCAGITTYSPMRHWNVGKGKKVGVVGLGGLGHMAVKFGRAFGAHVVVFTTSPHKKEDAQRLGANEVVVSRNANEMQKHAGSFDFILDAVSAEHDINAYINLLARDGNLTLVGAPPKPLGVSAFSLIMGRRSLSGSNIGGIPETQEMIDFCGQHNITADVEVIPIQKVNEAYDRMAKSDVKYRFSIDMASLKAE